MVTLLVILIVFGYMGWRRGTTREVIVLASILVAQLVRTTRAGDVVFGLINNVWSMFRLVLHLVFTRPQPPLPQAFAELEQMEPLISPARREPVLFLMFVGVILMGYWISDSVPKRPSPFAALLGMLNGYLIGSLILPLLPRALPAALPGQRVTEEQRREAGRIAVQGVKQLGDALGISPVYLVMLVVALLILWAVRELR